MKQHYARSTKTNTGPTCTGINKPQFIYSLLSQGGTLGGSSGAPAMLASGGQVVGQLAGGCGPTAATDACDLANREVDGAFATTFSSISQFLNPQVQPGPCVADADTGCLNNDRFKVEATFLTGGGQSGQAQFVELTPDTGYLWFFSPSNVEAVVKVLNACGLNNRFWVFAGGLTDVQVILTVTDTQAGVPKIYTNPQGSPFQPIQDTNAFATCP
jgi:hypothetical protein